MVLFLPVVLLVYVSKIVVFLGKQFMFFASFLFYFIVGSLGTCLFFIITQPVGMALLFAGCIRQDDCPNQTELEFYLTLFEGINTIWIHSLEVCKFVYRIISSYKLDGTNFSFRPLRLRKIKRSMLKAILDSGATTNLVRRCLFGDTILAAGLDVDLALGAVGQGSLTKITAEIVVPPVDQQLLSMGKVVEAGGKVHWTDPKEVLLDLGGKQLTLPVEDSCPLLSEEITEMIREFQFRHRFPNQPTSPSLQSVSPFLLGQ